eukprot:4958240-Alexandrium_andersonii.AAC.1
MPQHHPVAQDTLKCATIKRILRTSERSSAQLRAFERASLPTHNWRTHSWTIPPFEQLAPVAECARS